jgi:hypothetical protein
VSRRRYADDLRASENHMETSMAERRLLLRVTLPPCETSPSAAFLNG